MNLVIGTIEAVKGYLVADWRILLIGILMAVTIDVYLDATQVRDFLRRKAKLSIPVTVAFGSITPLCACGTMAVLISMFASAMPWGPVMAFLVSSPLTSPSEYFFETAFLGNSFANAMLISSIVLGLTAGGLANLLDEKTRFFEGQYRNINITYGAQSSGCAENNIGATNNISIESPSQTPVQTFCACYSATNASDNGTLSASPTFLSIMDIAQKIKLRRFLHSFFEIGIKRILFYFIIFIAVGKVVESLIPVSWISSLLGEQQDWSIALAATMGLPLYISSSSALPLMATLTQAGASQGAILAFLIAGKATGIPVIAGMSTFIRGRALFFYVAFVYIGAMIAGFAYQIILHI